MKKTLLMLCFGTIGLQGWATDWFINGDATPIGWYDDTEKHQLTAFVPQSDGKTYIWIGKLVVGNEGFKLGNTDGLTGYGTCHPSTANLEIDIAGTDNITYSDDVDGGDSDTKWKVSKDGIYKLTIVEGDGDAATLTCEDFTPTISQDDEGYYQIGTAAELLEFAELVSHDGIPANSAARLTADIDMSGVAVAPIGTSVIPYAGEFDGQGHWIKNLRIVRDWVNVALFGVTDGANLHDFGLDGAYICISGDKQNAAGIVGKAMGSEKSTFVNRVAVMNSYVEGYDHVGAIAGTTEIGRIYIHNCLSDAHVHTRSYQAGGIVGTAKSLTLSNCLFEGQVTSDNTNVSGILGLVEDISSSEVEHCVVAASLLSVSEGGTINGEDDPILYRDGREAVVNGNVALSTLHVKTGGDSEPRIVDYSNNGGSHPELKTFSAHDMQCKSFYTETMGWDMVNDWKFYAAGHYPVLAWMDAETSQAVTVREAGYTTIVAKEELDFTGSDAAAYKGQIVANDHVHLEPVTKVPAGTALIIKAAEGSYEVPYAVEYADALEDNDLLASDGTVQGGDDIYGLAEIGGKVGFYPVDSRICVPDGKAYIRIENGAGIKGYTFTFDDDATTINEELRMKSEESEGKVIYNIAGLRLSKTQKGINIVNGKKVKVK